MLLNKLVLNASEPIVIGSENIRSNKDGPCSHIIYTLVTETMQRFKRTIRPMREMHTVVFWKLSKEDYYHA